MALTDALKTLLIETAKSLKGSARRLLMARTVKALGPGGHQRAAHERRGGRRTMRKGLRALASGVRCLDAFRLRGRKRAAEPLPTRLTARRALGDSQSQVDPQCRSHRLSTRLTAAAGRRKLSAHKGSLDATRPTAATIGTKVKEGGDYPQQVAPSQPQKNSRQPPPSATRERRSSGRPMPRRRGDASPWRPKRPSKAVRVRGVARAASRPLPPTTTFTPMRP
jgi:hypothetical protein